MKCPRIALLLLALIVASQTAGIRAADYCALLANEQATLLPLPGLENFWSTNSCQSPVAQQNDEAVADAGSPYDMYYARGLYLGSLAKTSDGETGREKAGFDEQTVVNATLDRCFQFSVSWFAINGKTALGYASRGWEQAVTFLRDHNPNSDETGLELDDTLDYLADLTDEMGPAESEQAESPMPEPVGHLFVVSRLNYGNTLVLGTLGKNVAIEDASVSETQHPLFAVFCSDDLAPTAEVAANFDAAALWQAAASPALTLSEQAEQRPAGVFSAATSVVTRVTQWVKWQFNPWNVAFRNISQQIARLDWTLWLKSEHADRAVRNTMPVKNPINR
jgi:hypothetical protein